MSPETIGPGRGFDPETQRMLRVIEIKVLVEDVTDLSNRVANLLAGRPSQLPRFETIMSRWSAATEHLKANLDRPVRMHPVPDWLAFDPQVAPTPGVAGVWFNAFMQHVRLLVRRFLSLAGYSPEAIQHAVTLEENYAALLRAVLPSGEVAS